MQTIQICLTLFINTFLLYMLRINIATIILGMVPRIPNLKMQIFENNEFTWTHREQSFILCAYSLGAALTSISSIKLARKYSSEKVILFSCYGSILMTLLCGFLAFLDDVPANASDVVLGWLIVFRFIIGLFAGVSYPCTFYLISDLVPPKWRARALLVALVGGNIGAACTNVYCIRLIGTTTWYKTFFISGLIGLPIVTCWAVLITLRPQDAYKKNDNKTPEYDTVPYKQILNSKAFIGLLILHATNMYGLHFFVFNWPTFYTYFDDMDFVQIGDFAAVGFAVRAAGAIQFATLSFYIVNGVEINGIQRTLLRKMFVFFSHICPGIIITIFAGFFLEEHIKEGSGDKERLRLACRGVFYSTLMLNGAIVETSFINSFELSPNYGPHLFATINAVGNFAAFVEPLVFGFIKLNDPECHIPWQLAFYLIGSLYLFGGVVFLILGGANAEPWNVVRTKGGGLREISYPKQRNYYTSLVLPKSQSEKSFESDSSDSTTNNTTSRISHSSSKSKRGMFISTKRFLSKAKNSLKMNNLNTVKPSREVVDAKTDTSAAIPVETFFRNPNSITEVASSSTAASSFRQKKNYVPKADIILEEDDDEEIGESSMEKESENYTKIKDSSTLVRKKKPITIHYPISNTTENKFNKPVPKDESSNNETEDPSEEVGEQSNISKLIAPESKTNTSGNKSKRNYIEINNLKDSKSNTSEKKRFKAGQKVSEQFSEVESYYESKAKSDTDKNFNRPSTSQSNKHKIENIRIVSTIDLYKRKSIASSSFEAGSSQYTGIDETEDKNKKLSDTTIETTDSNANNSNEDDQNIGDERKKKKNNRKYYLMKKF